MINKFELPRIMDNESVSITHLNKFAQGEEIRSHDKNKKHKDLVMVSNTLSPYGLPIHNPSKSMANN